MSIHVDRIQPLEASHFWFVGRERLLLELLARHSTPSPDRRFADVGCGTGRFAKILSDFSPLVTAADLVLPPELPTGPSFLRCDVNELPYKSCSIDVLFVRDVFEHVDDDVAAFVEAKRVLAPGGVLFATVPAWPSLWSRRDVAAGHKRRYTRTSLRAACTSAQLEILEIRGYQFFALPVFALSRLLARREDSQLRREERLGVSNSIFGWINRIEFMMGKVRFLRPLTGSSLVLVVTSRD